MGDRNVGRELAFQSVFQLAFERATMDDIVAKMMDDESIRQEAREFARDLAVGTHDHLADIDAAIKEHTTNWDPDRLGNTDRAILRLATYEITQREDITSEVSINEAVELAKKFGDDDSPKFVNGVLDEIRKQLGKKA